MLTQQRIQELIEVPKTIIRRRPSHGYREENGSRYAKPHIHRITQQEITSGSTQPQERDRAITDQYATLEQALWDFFNHANVSNHNEYFREIAQMSLFDGHQ